MRTRKKYGQRKILLERSIRLSSRYKKQLLRNAKVLTSDYTSGLISYSAYVTEYRRLEKKYDYYNSCIEHYESQLSEVRDEIRKSNFRTIGVSALLVMLVVSGFWLFSGLTDVSITGFAIYEPSGIVNETINLSINGFVADDAWLEASLIDQSVNLSVMEFYSDWSSYNISNSTMNGTNISVLEVDLSMFSLSVPDKEGNYTGYLVLWDNFSNASSEFIIEVITPEILEETVTVEEVVTIEEDTIDITFDRSLDCHKCGQHKTPPTSDVLITVSASSSGELIDYYPRSWTLVDASGGNSGTLDSRYNFIKWDNVSEASYTIRSPDKTSPPTKYYFYSSLDESNSSEWQVIVADPALPQEIVEGEYGYDSETQIMTDSNGLQYKTNNNGIITINNNRYLAFMLKGTIDGTDSTYTSMNFSWTWHMEQNGSDYIFWAENNNANFIWRQYYYFYESLLKPMKIRHYLENNLADITNTQMYYMTNVSDSDLIEYRDNAYVVGEMHPIKPEYLQGDFSNDKNAIYFNEQFGFKFEDLVKNGFTINEFYLGDGLFAEIPGIKLMAIGFTKNEGNFPSGTSVWVDPTLTTDDLEGVRVSPINESAFAVVWCDETANAINYAVFDASGTTLKAETVIDDAVAACPTGTNNVDVAAINSTDILISYYDSDDDDVTYIVGNWLSLSTSSTQYDVDQTAGSTSLCADGVALTETRFAFAWIDDGDRTEVATVAVYDYPNTQVGSDQILSGDVATSAGCTIDAFNSTNFVAGWYDSTDDDVSYTSFEVVGSSITDLTGEIDVDTDVGAVDDSSPEIAILNETHFVFVYNDGTDTHMSFEIHDFAGNEILAEQDIDTSVAVNDDLDVAGLNDTSFVTIHEDAIGTTTTYSVYDWSNKIASLAYAPEAEYVYVSIGAREYAMGIEFCDDNFVGAAGDEKWQANSSAGAWDGSCPKSITWNETSHDFGNNNVDDGNRTGYFTITAEKVDHTNVKMDCQGDCDDIQHNWTTINVNQDITEWVKIDCSNNSVGTYQAIFNITSDQTPSDSLLTIDCQMTAYGNLVVNLTYPPENVSINANESFSINATIECVGITGATCGSVEGSVRYNESSGAADRIVNTSSVGGEELYVVGGGASGGNTVAYWRPVNWTNVTVGTSGFDSAVEDPVNGTKFYYNDTVDYTYLLGGAGGSNYANLTYWFDITEGLSEGELIYTYEGDGSSGSVAIYLLNDTAGVYDILKSGTVSLGTFLQKLDNNYINSSGGVEVVLEVNGVSGPAKAKLWDIHLTTPGNTYDGWGRQSGDSDFNITEANTACSGEWCTGGDEITNGEYDQINQSDFIKWIASASAGEILYHEINIKLNESENDLSGLNILASSFNDGAGGSAIWKYWNDTASNWDTWFVDSGQGSTNEVTTILEVEDSAGVKNLITSNGFLHLMIQTEALGDSVSVDYVRVTAISIGGSASNPDSSCESMSQGDSCQLNWTLNMTHSGQYVLDVNFTSSESNVAENNTDDILITNETGIPNAVPSLQLLEINSSDEFGGMNLTNETIWGSFVPADDDVEADLTCEFRWFKDGDNTVNFTSISCTNGTRIVYPLMSANTTKGDNWSFEGLVDDQDANTTTPVASINLTILNSLPSEPHLAGPLNGSYSVGIPDMNWSNSTDADSVDSITYYLEIDNDWDFSSPTYANSAITETANVTSDGAVSGLSFNIDYWWRVLAYDDTGNSSWSEVKNFSVAEANVAPSLQLLEINTTDGASLGLNYTNETIWGSFVPADDNLVEGDLTCEFRWFKDGVNVMNFTSISCTNATRIDFPVTPENTSRGENWSFEGLVDDQEVNSSAIASINLTIVNTPPVIVSIEFNGTLTITENDTSNYTISFLVNDSDGLADLQGSATEVSANITDLATETTTKTNSSCAYMGDVNGFSNYSCIFSLWFYDPSGPYRVSASVKDITGAYVQNVTQYAFVESTTSASIDPSSLSFGTLYRNAFNYTASDDPITLINIANDPIADGSIKVKAISMWDDATGVYSIPAANFTVDIDTGGSCVDDACVECDGTPMVNSSAQGIVGASLAIGADVSEDLYACLTHVPYNTTEDTYQTLTDQEWVVSIE